MRSSGSCVAIGAYAASRGVSEGLAEMWDGANWTLMKTAPVPAAGTMLAGVSCYAVRDCVAAGNDLNSNTDAWLTLAEVWHGSAWKAQQTPQATGSIVDDLQGVSCTSKSECTAVGYYINGNGVGDSLGATLAEAWNGSAWAIAPTPNPGGLDVGDLESVSCASANACTAVGYFYRDSGNDKTLSEGWNGSEWTLETAVDPTTATSSLSSVSCPVQSECFAAGSYEARFKASLPLLEVRADTRLGTDTGPGIKGDGFEHPPRRFLRVDNCVHGCRLLCRQSVDNRHAGRGLERVEMADRPDAEGRGLGQEHAR